MNHNNSYNNHNNNNSVFHVHENESTFEFSNEDQLLNFSNSSHLLDQNEFLFNTILPYQTPPPVREDKEETPKQRNPCNDKGKQKAVVVGPKGPSRRTGKKDRHSKIYTAQGPRDRRMRLSLQIARKFFDLQDMLGFDKASKTIEWLFNKSKSAIKDLSDKTLIIPSSPLNNNDDINNDNERFRDGKANKQMVEGNGGPRSKESRAKAREWARRRTKEKLMKKKEGEINNKGMEQNPNTRVSDDYQIMQQPLEDQMASVGIIERFLASSSSSMTDFQHGYDNNRGFGPRTIEQMMRYTDVGFEGVPGNYADYGFLNRNYNQGI